MRNQKTYDSTLSKSGKTEINGLGRHRISTTIEDLEYCHKIVTGTKGLPGSWKEQTRKDCGESFNDGKFYTPIGWKEYCKKTGTEIDFEFKF